jgi:RNA ligase
MDHIIETLEDVLPHIVPDTGIFHFDHDGYSVINYLYTLDNTFDSALARECRGLKFDPDGRLIARPFHKFFNLGEKRPVQEEPWDASHAVLDKLDGSMIHPAIVGGEMVFMTRMGISAQSRAAWAVAGPEIKALCADMIATGFTPIFEFTSPENRVVLAYDVPQLTLLAIRHMRSGAYMPHAELEAVASRHSVPIVAQFGSVANVNRFWTDARALEGVEGYVIAFEDGHRLKIKADAYVLRHKALAGLAHEKNLLAWVAKGALDDVLPLLAPEAAAQVQSYHDEVMRAVDVQAGEIDAFVSEHRELARKEFALKAKAELDPRLQSVAFRALDGTPPSKSLLDILERAAGSENKVEAIRPLFGMQWQPISTPE